MKKLFLLFILSAYCLHADASVDSVNSTDRQTLEQRLTDLEAKAREQEASRAAAQQQANSSIATRYDNDLNALRQGLDNGREIETAIDATTKFLALKDLVETIGQINNPSTEAVGTAFTDVVINSASTYLLPVYNDAARNAATRAKFKSILTAIYNSPIAQGLLNSNPISSTINAAINQAGFFEKTVAQSINKKQVKKGLIIETGNVAGTAFNDTALQAFYNDIEARVNFYKKIAQINAEQTAKTTEMKAEALVIARSLKAGRKEICKLLNLDPTSASVVVSFDSVYRVAVTTNAQKTQNMGNRNFRRAIEMSNYAAEELPNVIAFKKKVLDEIAATIDQYIHVLEESKQNATAAKLSVPALNSQIAHLKGIQNNIKA